MFLSFWDPREASICEFVLELVFHWIRLSPPALGFIDAATDKLYVYSLRVLANGYKKKMDQEIKLLDYRQEFIQVITDGLSAPWK